MLPKWVLRVGWALAVVVAWCFVADGAAKNFFIENTDDALREARSGQAEAAVAAAALLAMGVLVLRVGGRFRRAAAWLVGGGAAVVLMTSGSEVVLFSGLLSALPVGLGALLGILPSPGPVGDRNLLDLAGSVEVPSGRQGAPWRDVVRISRSGRRR